MRLPWRLGRLVLEFMGFSSFVLKTDERVERFSHHKWAGLIFFVGLFLFLAILYFCFCFAPRSYYDIYQNDLPLAAQFLGFGSWVQSGIYLGLAAISLGLAIASLVILKKHGRLTSAKMTGFYVYVGCLLMVSYLFILKVNTQVGHMDWCVWNYYDDGNTDFRPGHWTVILDIFRHGSVEEMPVVNGAYWYGNQYYQNKFWHYLMAYWMKFNGLFINVGNAQTADAIRHSFAFTETEDVLFETIRIPVAYIGCCTLIMVPKLAGKFHVKGTTLTIAMACFAFTPMLIALPAYLNNDSLAFFFSELALYYALEWYDTYSWKSIVLIAVTLGLGMATKFNVGVLSVPIAALFVYDLIGLYQKKEGGFTEKFVSHPYRTFWLQILVFAVIVFPLGLFFAIYNNAKWGIPFGFVWDNGHDSSIYISPDAYPWPLRFLIFPAPDMFFSLWFLPFRRGVKGNYYDVWGTQDFNVWTGFFKTTLFNGANFGDYAIGSNPYLIAGGAIIYSIGFIIAMFALVYIWWYVVNWIRGHHKIVHDFSFYALLSLAVVEAVSYIYFNDRYPYNCTMYARYIVMFYFPLYFALGHGVVKAKRYLAFLSYRKRNLSKSA